MKELYLIRHGKTEANEKHQYCGVSDLPLSEAGAAALSAIRYEIPPCRFFTSGMKRTEQTLQLLFGEVPHERDTRFREISFGEFELHTYEELKNRQDYRHWIDRDGQDAPPGGESAEAFQSRILDGLRDLLALEAPAVLITHGGVIALIMDHLFPEEGKNRYQWQPEPGCGYRLTPGAYEKLMPLERR